MISGDGKPVRDRRDSYLGERDVGNNDNVDGAGGILGGSRGITAGVVLVLASARTRLPGHGVLGLGNGSLGGRGGRVAGFGRGEHKMLELLFVFSHLCLDWGRDKRHTEVVTGTNEGGNHDTTEDLYSEQHELPR